MYDDRERGLTLLSATDVSAWGECKRKWGFRYIDGIKPPKHPGALLGTEVQDEQLDPYLMSGREFDFSKGKSAEIANALRSLMPAPMAPGLRLRRKFVVNSPRGGFGYQGEFDVWGEHASVVPGLERSPWKLLGDFKTTRNLKYAKTDETLLTDVQAMLYSMVSIVEDNVDELDLVWWTSRTVKPWRAVRSHLHVRAPHVVAQFQRIDEIGAEIVSTRRFVNKAEELPPNPRMCEAYGGCPYRHKCNLSPAAYAAAVNVEAIVNAGTNDFLAALRKGAPPAPAAQPAPAPTHPAILVAVNPFAAPHQVAQPAPTPIMSDRDVPAPTAIPPQFLAPVAAPPPGSVMGAATPPAINPPEAALPPAQPVGAVVASPAPAAEPAKRGRPRKTDAAPEQPKTVAEALGAGQPGPKLDELEAIVGRMRAAGVKKLCLMEGKIYEVALFENVRVQS